MQTELHYMHEYNVKKKKKDFIKATENRIKDQTQVFTPLSTCNSQ